MATPFSVMFDRVFPYAPTLIFIYLLISRTLTWYRLRHFKGPLLAKFSHFFTIKTAASARMGQIYMEVSQKYGALARVGPNDLLTDDPELIRRMSSARSAYSRSSWYESSRVDPYVDSIGSEMDTRVHDARRAKMANAYGGKENPNLEADIDICIMQWIEVIRAKYISTNDSVRPMDLATKAQYFTLDVISKLAYGDEFGYIRSDKDIHGYLKTTEDILLYVATFTSVPLVNAILNRNWVKKLIGPGPNDKHGIGQMMGVAKRVVGQRFGDNKVEKQDMLGAFVRNGIPQRQIEAEVMLQILAGSDTTATAIRATMLYLLSHPRVFNKLRAELDNAKGTISNPITNAESKALPYLQAVVKEGVRIHPPFTGLIMKKVPPEGDNFNGQYIPGGTRVGHSMLSLQRNKVFGNDVDIFRPERWLTADPERLRKMEQCLDLVFGYGRWVCLGKNVAWIELNKVFVELLRNFEFELIRPDHAWNSRNYILFLQRDMWVRVTERDRS